MANHGSRKISREEVDVFKPAIPAIGDLIHTLMVESDRGCVLVAAAIVDEELEMLFRAWFQSRSKASKQEMDFLLTQRPQPPLQSTAIKIRLALASGIIESPLAKALLELQSWRSRVAAHSRTHVEITKERTLLVAQHLPKETVAELTEFLDCPEQNFPAHPVVTPLKFTFAKIVAFLVGCIHATTEHYQKNIHTGGSSDSAALVAQTKATKRDSSDKSDHTSRKDAGT